MTTGAPAENTTGFHVARPTDLRRARLWHRLGYIVWLLPRRLSALAQMLSVQPTGRVLDYGCAEKPYRRFFAEGVDFVGADLPGNPVADVTIADDGTVPLEASSFDAVLSTQVLEHVAEPSNYLAECMRVLRPGGRMLLSTHGLMVYHPDPVDYWRWTEAGLQRAVEAAGFSVLHAEGLMGLGAVGLQFVQDSIYHRMPKWLQPLVALCFQSLIILSDRFESSANRKGNALVYALVVEKPRRGGRAPA